MTKHDIHHPIRTCVSCGKKRNKDELIRLFLDRERNLLIDISGKKNGRGIYICDSSSCRKRLLKNRSLNRRFRTDKVITIGPDLMNESAYDSIITRRKITRDFGGLNG